MEKQVLQDNKTKGINYLIVAIIFLATLLVGESLYIFGLHRNTQQTEDTESAISTLENLISVKGVVRTAGLSDTEKEEFELPEVTFQITDLEDNTQPETHGYFLQGSDVEAYEGKCVQIIGSIPDEWVDEKIKAQDDRKKFVLEYNRTVLVSHKIEQLDYLSCQPYFDLEPVGETQLRGTIIRSHRTSPILNDDYEFKLEDPSLSDLGFENNPEDFALVVLPATNDVWATFENYIDNEIVVSGYVNKSGYFPGDSIGNFVVDEVRPLILNRTVPPEIYPEQIIETYTFDDTYFALYQKSNINIHLPQSNEVSGILYSHKDDLEWKEFSTIEEISDSSNNPYFFDFNNGIYYVLIVDANGAGSGEGNAKLMSLKSGETVWNLESCFYYGDLGFDWSQEGLEESVITYLETHPDAVGNAVEEHCSDFHITQL